MQQIDTLIIGQGLAGSLLAWSLFHSGQKILVIDDNHKTSSTMVAAGLLNPVTGKRLLKAENTDIHLDTAIFLYRELEDFFGQQFYYPLSMTRLFRSEQQQAYFLERNKDEAYSGYFAREIDESEDLSPLQNEFGGVIQKQTGYLDTETLLHHLGDWLNKQQALVKDRFDHSQLRVKASSIEWKDIEAKRCIFCEGYMALQNPWFDWLPFQPAKGEILTLEMVKDRPDSIINKGNWLIPLHLPQQVKTGATNDWNKINGKPTQNGKQKVLRDFEDLFEVPPEYEVIQHKAGVRPATRDKQLFIGPHPELSPLWMFNGFGARGTLLIPYYAKILSRNIMHQKPLPDAANISRYFEK